MKHSVSLRERKKQQTRSRLVEVSSRLFAEQGYDATTLEQICSEADVSVPTLLSYFESKERLALAPNYDRFEELRDLITDPERIRSTLEIWAEFWPEGSRLGMGHPMWLAGRIRARTASLGGGYLSLLSAYQGILAQGLADDYRTDSSRDIGTNVLAIVLSYSAHILQRQWLDSAGEMDLEARTAELVDYVLNKLPRPAEMEAQ